MNFNIHYSEMYSGNNKNKIKTKTCSNWPTSRFEFAVCNANGGEVSSGCILLVCRL